jgi:ubiquinone/menaquinone biosynthesis C-methylase UbiE
MSPRSPVFRSLGFIRGLSYFAQSQALNRIGRLLFRLPAPDIDQDEKLKKVARKALFELIERDAARFSDGTYPTSAHDGFDFVRSWVRSPKIIFRSLSVFKRRKNKDWSVNTRDPLYPKYYQRSFHYQENGYQSPESAKLYDEQVELLFAGSANAMRRMILIPLRTALEQHTSTNQKFKVLEVASGTGTSTKLLHAELMQSKRPFELWVSDLSADYMEHAKDACKALPQTFFFQADASQLPFDQGTFDFVAVTFLWHELPNDIRALALKNCMRVLKPQGTLASVESLQFGDVEALDPLLHQFPIEFHEPFFKNYALQKMEENTDLGRPFHREIGFLSKCLAWKKP